MTTPASTASWRQTIPADRLRPGKDNPRTDPGDLEGLAQSIVKEGLKQPILVVAIPDSEDYEIEDGWRRYLAMTEGLGFEEIPAIIVPPSRSENKSVRALYTALITDVHKKGLNQIERARGFKRLQDEFGFTATEIARQVGLSVSTVTNSLMLMQLDPKTQDMIAKKEISVQDVQNLLREYRKRQRRRQGKPDMGAVWEPPWFAAKHPLARQAESLCNSRNHNTRRRYGAAGKYRGACGQCWQSCIESDYEKVLLAAGWQPPEALRRNLRAEPESGGETRS